MAFPVSTRSAGNLITASIWNADIVANMNAIVKANWTSVAFSAGNFTGNGSMTWTFDAGDQVAFRYEVILNTMTVFVDIQNTTVGGTLNTALQIAIPGGYAATNDNEGYQPVRIINNGTAAFGYALVRNTGAGIQIFRTVDGTTNWSSATNASGVQGTIRFQVA